MKELRIFCQAIKQDVPTAAGNIYSYAVMDRIAELSNELSWRQNCFAVFESQVDRPMLADTAARVEFVALWNGLFEVNLDILDTPKGVLMANMNPKLLSVTPWTVGTVTDQMVAADGLKVLGWKIERSERSEGAK